MKPSILALTLLCGCSTFKSDQTQTAPDGTVTRTVVRVRSFWDSHSELAKLKTTLTEKQQGISIGSMTQESSGTNATALLQALAAGMTEGAMKAMKP